MEIFIVLIGLAKYFVLGAWIVIMLQQNGLLAPKLNTALFVMFSFLFGTLTTSFFLHFGLVANLLPHMHIFTSILAIIALVLLAFRHGKTLSTVFRGDWKMRALFIVGYLSQVLLLAFQPVMANDARAIWLLKAKSLFYGASGFFEFLASPNFLYSHQDYPIGLPLLYADLMHNLGHFWEPAIGIFSFTFFFLLIVGLYGTIRKYNLTNTLGALIIALVILFTPEYLKQGWSGLADIPLSLAFFGALLALQLNSETKMALPYIVPIGLAAFSATIKNEGITFLLLILIVSFFIYLLAIFTKNNTTDRKNIIKQVILTFAWTTLALLPLFLWKIISWKFGLSNDITSSLNLREITSRIPLLITETSERLFNCYQFGILLVPALLFIPFPKRLSKPSYVSIIVLGQAVIYLLIYLVTPNDLFWHISTSFNRLVLQLLPSIFLLTFIHLSSVISTEKAPSC